MVHMASVQSTNQLPNEIYLRIFNFLPLSSLANVSRVCKQWYSLYLLLLSKMKQLPESFSLKDHQELKNILPRLTSLEVIPRHIASLLNFSEIRSVITSSCPHIKSVIRPRTIVDLLSLIKEGNYSLTKIELDDIKSKQELDSLNELIELNSSVLLHLEWNEFMALHQPSAVLARIQFLRWRNTTNMNELSIHLASEKMHLLTGLSLSSIFIWEDRLILSLLNVFSTRLKNLRLTCSVKLLSQLPKLECLEVLSWCMTDDRKVEDIIPSLCQFFTSSGTKLIDLEILGSHYLGKSSKKQQESRVILLSTIFDNCPRIKKVNVNNLFFARLKVDGLHLLVKPWTDEKLGPLLQLMEPNKRLHKLTIEGSEIKYLPTEWKRQIEKLPLYFEVK